MNKVAKEMGTKPPEKPAETPAEPVKPKLFDEAAKGEPEKATANDEGK